MKFDRLGVGARILALAASLLVAAQAFCADRSAAFVERRRREDGDRRLRADDHHAGQPAVRAPGERIATFDQDGTLWVEHPMYTQVMYVLERVPALVKAKPELAKVAPYSTVLECSRATARRWRS